MPDDLKCLVIEDGDADFRLIEHHLGRTGYPIRCSRIQTTAELAGALDDPAWDLILSDYNVPGMRFETCLPMIVARQPDTPLVLVSGAIGEEKAVALLKQGVWDFVLKDSLERLKAAVDYSLREAKTRRRLKLTETALHETLLRFEAAKKASGLGIYDHDIRTGRLDWDDRVRELWGVPPDEPVTYEMFLAGLHPEDRGRIVAALAESWDPRGSGEFAVEQRVVGLKDGKERRIAARGQTSFDGEKPIRSIGTVFDVTEQRRTENELAEALMEKSRLQEAALTATIDLYHAARLTLLGEMASTIAHEVNQPISAAVNFLHAAKSVATDPIVRGFLDDVDAQLFNVAAIVQKVRDFAANRTVHPAPQRLNSIVAEAATLGLLSKTERDITLCLAVPEDLPEVLVDIVQIRQVLVNLIRNAAQAMAGVERKELTISAAFAAERALVELSVADTGPGFPDEIRQHLFTPFVTTKPDGTGLGLSTSRAIIQAHGGQLWIEDDETGATIRMTLPIAAADA